MKGTHQAQIVLNVLDRWFWLLLFFLFFLFFFFSPTFYVVILLNQTAALGHRVSISCMLVSAGLCMLAVSGSDNLGELEISSL